MKASSSLLWEFIASCLSTEELVELDRLQDLALDYALGCMNQDELDELEGLMCRK